MHLVFILEIPILLFILSSTLAFINMKGVFFVISISSHLHCFSCSSFHISFVCVMLFHHAFSHLLFGLWFKLLYSSLSNTL